MLGRASALKVSQLFVISNIQSFSTVPQQFSENYRTTGEIKHGFVVENK